VDHTERSRYLELLSQADEVAKQAEVARQQELPGVIEHVQSLMRTYGISPADLGNRRVRVRRTAESHPHSRSATELNHQVSVGGSSSEPAPQSSVETPGQR
jgi:DNA-binding protein H-NS